MRTLIFFLVFICVPLSLCQAQKRPIVSSTQKYESPDKSIMATVTSTSVPEATDESIIALRTTAGELLAHKNYSSEDGEHGYGVVRAMWTPDSQYFVYSLTSSGGHQAWHSRVKFFSRKQNKIFSLDDALGDAVTNPRFSVAAPDVVIVELLSGQQKSAVSLSKLQIK